MFLRICNFQGRQLVLNRHLEHLVCQHPWVLTSTNNLQRDIADQNFFFFLTLIFFQEKGYF